MKLKVTSNIEIISKMRPFLDLSQNDLKKLITVIDLELKVINSVPKELVIPIFLDLMNELALRETNGTNI